MATTKRDKQLVMVDMWPTFEYFLGAEMLPSPAFLAKYYVER